MTTAKSSTSAETQTSGKTQTRGEPANVTTAERLKKDFEARKAADRPMSHSLAVAYQKVIAQCSQNTQTDPLTQRN